MVDKDNHPGDNTNFIVEWTADGESKMEHHDTESQAREFVGDLPRGAKNIKLVKQVRTVIHEWDE